MKRKLKLIPITSQAKHPTIQSTQEYLTHIASYYPQSKKKKKKKRSSQNSSPTASETRNKDHNKLSHTLDWSPPHFLAPDRYKGEIYILKYENKSFTKVHKYLKPISYVNYT